MDNHLDTHQQQPTSSCPISQREGSFSVPPGPNAAGDDHPRRNTLTLALDNNTNSFTHARSLSTDHINNFATMSGAAIMARPPGRMPPSPTRSLGRKVSKMSKGMASGNPRRFNDKIALQQMRQAEHEKQMRLIHDEVDAHIRNASTARVMGPPHGGYVPAHFHQQYAQLSLIHI